MISTKKTANIQKYKLEPPEGGWGYLVCLGMILAFVTALAELHCYGLLFNGFLKQTGIGTSVVATASAVTFGAMSMAGLLSNTLIQRFGKRPTGVAGAIIYCSGIGLQMMANSSILLLVAAILHGISFGFMIPIIFSTFNHYFVRRRAFMMSLTQVVIGIGNMGAPILIEFLLDKYGHKGCLAIIMALCGHCIFAMLIMHPVEWHMKKVPMTEEELQEARANEKVNNEKDHLKPLIAEDRERNHMSSLGSLRRLKAEEAMGKSKSTSLASLTNWTGSVIVTEAIEPEPKTTGKWKLIIDFMDLTLLKDLVYVNIVLGITLAYYADINFYAFHPLYMFQMNYSQLEVSRILAIGAGADLVSRCVLALISSFSQFRPRYIYMIGALFSIVVRYAFLFAIDFWSMAIVTAFIGFLKTWMHIPMPLIFAEHLSKERFHSGYGLFMCLQGLITFALGPVVGFIRDKSNSYSIAFLFLNACLVINAIAWMTEMYWKQCSKQPDSEGDGGEGKKSSL